MTRKDYQLIAGVILSLKDDYNRVNTPGLYNAMNCLANRLAGELEQDNPRFDRTRFLTACGVN